MAAGVAISLFVWWPRPETPQPQKQIVDIETEFKADDYLFADARKRCRGAIKKVEPGAKFLRAENIKYGRSAIIRLDWQNGKAEHRSYCKIKDQKVIMVTVDNALIFSEEK